MAPPFPIADGNFGTALLPGSSRRAAHGGRQDRIGLGEESGGYKLGSRVTALQLLQLLQLEFIMSEPPFIDFITIYILNRYI